MSDRSHSTLAGAGSGLQNTSTSRSSAPHQQTHGSHAGTSANIPVDFDSSDAWSDISEQGTANPNTRDQERDRLLHRLKLESRRKISEVKPAEAPKQADLHTDPALRNTLGRLGMTTEGPVFYGDFDMDHDLQEDKGNNDSKGPNV